MILLLPFLILLADVPVILVYWLLERRASIAKAFRPAHTAITGWEEGVRQ